MHRCYSTHLYSQKVFHGVLEETGKGTLHSGDTTFAESEHTATPLKGPPFIYSLSCEV